jgi:hypothetical protein
MSGLQSKIKLQARKETMFQTKYGTDTIPNTSQTSLRARGWRKLLETCLHFRAWFLKPPTSNTQDEIVNKGNKQKAILTANYGPKEDERMCGNCEYGNKLKGCGLRKNEVFCEIFEFKCAKENVCDAWDSGEEED